MTNKSTSSTNDDDESPSPSSPLPRKKTQVHPMIPVPQAIRTVLTETALTLTSSLFNNGTSRTQTLLVGHSSSSNNPIDVDVDGDDDSDRDDNKEGGEWSPSLIGRISAQHITAPAPGYPAYNASIMDGYAIHLDSFTTTEPTTNEDDTIRFQVVDRILAGRVVLKDDDDDDNTTPTDTREVVLPKAIYITTGAVIPNSYNAVIPLEHVLVLPPNTNTKNIQQIIIRSTILQQTAKKGGNRWIRPIGCDIPTGTTILTPGQVIEPLHAGLLRQCNIPQVVVTRRPIVGVLSTGNELRSDHTTAPSSSSATTAVGQIPDANRPILLSLLTNYQSCQPIDLGITHNDQNVEQLSALLEEATRTCDVVITTGGISRGDADIVELAIKGIGGGGSDDDGCSSRSRILFGRLLMKPGKPTTFAIVEPSLDCGDGDGIGGGRCLVFAMPGNPVSAYVCTELLVRPCLDMMHRYYHHHHSTTRTTALTTGLLSAQPNDGDSPPQFQQISTSTSTSQLQIAQMVQNAIVHSEINATLTHRVKLDVERPEYHRVTLSYVPSNNNNTPSGGGGEFQATSTGVQRSSRILSMHHADGLMVMPQGDKWSGKVMAEAGESYPVLLLRSPFLGGGGGLGGIRWGDSMHRRRGRLAIGILEVGGSSSSNSTTIEEGSHNLAEKVTRSLGGTNQASVIQTISLPHHHHSASQITTTNTNLNLQQHSLIPTILQSSNHLSTNLDILLVICRSTPTMTFQTNLDVAAILRTVITKEADSLAMLVRKGASLECAISALFEPVVGFYDGARGNDCSGSGSDGKACLLMSVPEDGMSGALERVRGLLRRALTLARGETIGG